MKFLKNEFVTVALDERYPRVLWYQDAAGTRINGEYDAVAPRLYLFRKSDRATLTSDDVEVQAAYTLDAQPAVGTYRANVSCDGQPAVEFDLVFTLNGRDLLVRLQDIREHAGYCLFSLRLHRLAGALSEEKDSRMVTCSYQGRLLDPSKCKPRMIDYSWVGFTARPCGAVYRPGFMVTVDLPGYEDLLVQEVRQYSRIVDAQTVAGIGGEIMYRQREVGDLAPQIKIYPPKEKCPAEIPSAEPILCGDHKDIRLHFISAAAGGKLDWTDAAKYFQSLVPAEIKCEPRYENTLVYKICMAHRHRPYMNFDQALDVIRQVCNVTGGMRQVCYLAYFQYDGGETGYPEMWEIYPPLGDKTMLRRVMEEAKKYNCVLSFHQNLDVFDSQAPSLEGKYVARDSLGRMASAGFWNPTQLLQVSYPAYLEEFRKHIDRLVNEYGIRETYHLDVFSGGPYAYDANPDTPRNCTAVLAAKKEVVKFFRSHGIDITSECLTDPYVDQIGHVWALFNGGTVWEGEQALPFANFVYHGATSWNSGTAKNEAAILQSLIQGGGASMEFPWGVFIPAEARLDVVPTPWPEVLDNLYLVHPPYMMLRSRKWSGMSADGTKRRVDYGKDSYIEVDDAKPGYKVVVDGKVLAEDFVTVVPAPDGKGFIAYARQDTDLDWPAPQGWADGPVRGEFLTTAGSGIRVEGAVAGGRLKIKLKAHEPVRVQP
jgi:hypothetical protein